MKREVFHIALILLLVCVCPGRSACADIIVSGQKDFENLQRSVLRLIGPGTRHVRVLLREGTYYYNDRHLYLKDMQCDNVSISIEGQGKCTLVSKGKTRRNGEQCEDWLNNQSTLLDSDLSEVSQWGETLQAKDTVRVVDEKTKTCFLPYMGLRPQPEEQCRNTYIMITRWFTSAIYNIKRIDREGIYFTCTDLEYSTYLDAWNVNGDYGYYTKVGGHGARFPRFKLCGVIGMRPLYIDNKVYVRQDSLYECRASTFLSIEQSSLESFKVSGIEFKGNAYGWNRGVVMAQGSTFGKGMSLQGNTFRNLKTEALRVDGTDDVSFCGNKVEDCAIGVVRSENNCRRTTVCDNRFVRCGLRFTNSFVVYCTGTDFLVKGNLFEDFGYSAIRSGVWWAQEMMHPCRGEICDNEMYYTDWYMSDIWKRTLMDSGAIYVATQTSGVNICRNSIHNYSGVYQNRGIFLDDGSSHCTVADNVVENIYGGYCIDLRKVTYKDNPRNKAREFNVGNVLRGNICDGKMRFETF